VLQETAPLAESRGSKYNIRPSLSFASVPEFLRESKLSGKGANGFKSPFSTAQPAQKTSTGGMNLKP
jgi:hypothetical protein